MNQNVIPVRQIPLLPTLAIAPRQTAQARIASAFLIASLVVAVLSYTRHITLLEYGQDWYEFIRWTSFLVLFLITRFTIFHRDYAILHLSDILVKAQGKRSHLLILCRGIEMVMWVLFARFDSPEYIIIWSTRIAAADFIVVLITRWLVAPENRIPLTSLNRIRVRNAFNNFLFHKLIGAAVLFVFGYLWIYWLGKETSILAISWHKDITQLDYWGMALVMCVAGVVLTFIYIRHSDAFFGFDRILEPEGPNFPEHGRFTVGGEVGSVLSCAAMTASLVLVSSTFSNILNLNRLNHALLITFLVYRALYFQRDYLIHMYRSSIQVGDLNEQMIDPRNIDLIAELVCSSLWLVLALSIEPSTATAIVIVILLLADYIKCALVSTSLGELNVDQARENLKAMLSWYFFINVFIILAVVIASLFYFSPAARNIEGTLLKLPLRDAIAVIAVGCVFLFALFPYFANRRGVAAVSVPHIL